MKVCAGQNKNLLLMAYKPLMRLDFSSPIITIRPNPSEEKSSEGFLFVLLKFFKVIHFVPRLQLVLDGRPLQGFSSAGGATTEDAPSITEAFALAQVDYSCTGLWKVHLAAQRQEHSSYSLPPKKTSSL